MEPKTIVITGASNGIGAAAARALAGAGHRVALVGRSPGKTQAMATELGAPFHLVDFSELAQVRRLADELLASYPVIDVLANNAGGIFADTRQVTGDGHETTFQVNYLAPFLLIHLLLGRLSASRATVINTSSMANRLMGKLDLTALENERSYSASRAYGNAKLAQIMYTSELQARHGASGLSAVAFHPGVVATGFASAPGSATRFAYNNPLFRRFLATPERAPTPWYGWRPPPRAPPGRPGRSWPSASR